MSTDVEVRRRKGLRHTSDGTPTWKIAREAAVAATQAKKEQLLEDVEQALNDGEAPWSIVARLGHDHPGRFRRKLRQLGRYDLADHFENVRDWRKAWFVEDVEELIDRKRGTAEIVERLGYTNWDSLARRLCRAGRPDLARRFWNANRPRL